MLMWTRYLIEVGHLWFLQLPLPDEKLHKVPGGVGLRILLVVRHSCSSVVVPLNCQLKQCGIIKYAGPRNLAVFQKDIGRWSQHSKTPRRLSMVWNIWDLKCVHNNRQFEHQTLTPTQTVITSEFSLLNMAKPYLRNIQTSAWGSLALQRNVASITLELRFGAQTV